LNKCSAVLLLFVLVSSSSIMSGLVCASTSKPSAPEFTLRHVVTPYNVPEVFRINPYTGANESISPSFNGERQYIEITVKNQQFTSYNDATGKLVNVYYNVSLKGHYRDVWGHYPDSAYEDLFNASASDYTVILVELGTIPSDGQLDFRLEALIGHYKYDRISSGVEYVNGFSAYETSGWSDTQTITVDESVPTATPGTSLPHPSASPSESQNPVVSPKQSGTASLTQLGLDWTEIAVVALLGVIAVSLAVTVVLLLTRRKKLIR